MRRTMTRAIKRDNVKVSDRLLDTVEDFTRVSDMLSQIVYAIRTGCEYPNYIPCMNDASLTDLMSDVIEELKKARGINE